MGLPQKVVVRNPPSCHGSRAKQKFENRCVFLLAWTPKNGGCSFWFPFKTDSLNLLVSLQNRQKGAPSLKNTRAHAKMEAPSPHINQGTSLNSEALSFLELVSPPFLVSKGNQGEPKPCLGSSPNTKTPQKKRKESNQQTNKQINDSSNNHLKIIEEKKDPKPLAPESRSRSQCLGPGRAAKAQQVQDLQHILRT